MVTQQQLQNPWITVLRKLPLSKAEVAVVKRFETDPVGRSFLPVADILRVHKKLDESVELLAHGVALHPDFVVARVVLAREYYGKGLFAQSWATLENSEGNLRENVLAQKLRFKLAVVCGLEEIAHECGRTLYIRQMHDTETRAIHDVLKTSEFRKAQERILHEFAREGIHPAIPDPSDFIAEARHAGPQGEDAILAGATNVQGTQSSRNKNVETSGSDEASIAAEGSARSAFQVLSLQEIFRGVEKDGEHQTSADLDSTTLADLYAKQGHFSKAIAVYRRLLKLTPSNDYLKRRLREATLDERRQKDMDLSIDPSIVDQMEAVDIIDRQASFFQRMLRSLGEKDERKL